MRRRLVLACLASVTASACSYDLSRSLEDGDVRGRAVVEQGNAEVAVAGAQVVAEHTSLRARTDARGRFVLRGLPSGGTVALSFSADVDGDGAQDRGLRLKSVDVGTDLGTLVLGQFAVVEGTAMHDGLPIPHARVVLDDGRVVEADENGRFRFDSVAPGDHTLVASGTNALGELVTGSAEVTVGRGGVADQPVILTHTPVAGFLRGTVSRQGSTDRAGLVVALENGALRRSYTTGADGVFGNEVLEAGLWRVRASDPTGAFLTATLPGVLVDGDNTPSPNLVLASASCTDCVPDGDGDGAPDESDNCPDRSNAGQADRDEDGLGDACDVCPDDAGTSQVDSNGDGLGDVCTASVVSVSSAAIPGIFGIGATIDIDVSFSLPVTISGTATLALSAGTSALATFVEAVDADTLRFRYVVAEGEHADPLEVAGTNALAGTLQGPHATPADLTLPADALGGSGVAVDGLPPGAFSLDDAPFLGVALPRTFTWTASEGAVAYEVVVGHGACTEVVTATTVIDTEARFDLLPDGELMLCVIARDAAGNTTEATDSGASFRIDITAPYVAAIVATTTAGLYAPGATLSFEVRLSEPVTFAAAPVLRLTTEAGTRDLTSTTASPSDVLAFTYVVAEGDLAAALAVDRFVSADAVDAGGNPLQTGLPAAPTVAALALDGVPPDPFAIDEGPLALAGLPRTLTWSAATGAATYALRIGTGSCVSTSIDEPALSAPSYALTSIPDGSYVVCVRATDAAGNSTNATNDGAALLVDATAPRLLSLATNRVFGLFGPGATIGFDFTVSEPVTSTGLTSLELQLDSGATRSIPLTISGTHLTATYTVADGDLAANLGTTRLTGAALRDAAGNALDPFVPAAAQLPPGFSVDAVPPGAFTIDAVAGGLHTLPTAISWTASAGAVSYTASYASPTCNTPIATYTVPTGLSAQLAGVVDSAGVLCVVARDAAGNTTVASNQGLPITIDQTVPTVTGVRPLVADGWFRAGDRIRVAVDFSEPVTAAATAQLQAFVSATPRLVPSLTTGPASTFEFEWLVDPGELTSDLDVSIAAGSAFTDAAGNPAVVTIPTGTRLADRAAIAVDAVPPAAFTISTGSTGATAMPRTINWTASAGAVDYELRASPPPLINPLRSLHTGATFATFTDLTDGLWAYCVRATDAAGNATDASNCPFSMSVDVTPPRATAVRAVSANGTYGIGQTVTLAVDFSEPVTFGASPPQLQLAFASGPVAKPFATFQTTASTFLVPFPVALGDSAPSLDAVALITNGLVDGVGNPALTTVPVGADPNSLATLSDINLNGIPAGAFSISPPGTGPFRSPKTFTWGAATGAVSYTVRIGNGSCASPIQTQTGLTGTSYAPTLTDGTYVLCVSAIDAATNVTPATNDGIAFTIDNTAPRISTITSSPVNATLGTGGTATITVNFDSIVRSTTAPQLTLATGGTGRVLTAAAPINGTSVSFAYTVLAGETSADLDVSLFSAPDAVDVAGNALNAAIPTGGRLSVSSALVVDGVAPGAFTISTTGFPTKLAQPTFTWAASSGATTYRLVIGAPSCAQIAQVHTSITGTSQQAAAGLAEGTYVVCVTAIDAAGNQTGATNNGVSVVIDRTAPVLQYVRAVTANGNYGAGTVLTVGMTFNEPVIYTSGFMQLTFDAGIRNANYARGSGSPRIEFDYTVVSGDNALDLDSPAYSGTIPIDLAGNTWANTFPPAGNALSLRVQSDLNVGTTAPAAFAINTPKTAYRSADTLDWTGAARAVSYTAALYTGATCGTGLLKTQTSAATTFPLTAVAEGNYLLCVTATGATGLSTLATNTGLTVKVDNTAPAVVKLRTPLANGLYRPGTIVDVDIDFTEPVIASTGALTLAITGSPVANYLSGSGSATLRYRWTYTGTATTNDLDAAYFDPGNAKDAAGNFATNTIPIGTVDPNALRAQYDIQLAPVSSASFTGLASDATWRTSKTWTWGCTSTCTYRFVVDNLPATEPTGPFGGNNSATTTVTGVVYLHVQLADAGGAISGTSHFQALVDSQPPDPFSGSFASSAFNEPTLTGLITWTALTDVGSGFGAQPLQVQVETNAGAVVVPWTALNLSAPRVAGTFTAGTSYVARLKAVDLAGNAALATIAPNYSSLCDTTPPTVSGVTLGSTPSDLSRSPTITPVVPADVGSGVAYFLARIRQGTTPVSSWMRLQSGGVIDANYGLNTTAAYNIELRPVDNAGNRGASVTSQTFTYGTAAQSNIRCAPTYATSLGSYTAGSESAYTVPAGQTYLCVEAVGGGGGSGAGGGTTGAGKGGGGGYAMSVVSVTPGETLYVRAGAGGGLAPNSSFTGGGAGGGGFSYVRRGTTYLVVAGGGGGGGGFRDINLAGDGGGGCGGDGGDAASNASGFGLGGGGGTFTTGGQAGAVMNGPPGGAVFSLAGGYLAGGIGRGNASGVGIGGVPGGANGGGFAYEAGGGGGGGGLFGGGGGGHGTMVSTGGGGGGGGGGGCLGSIVLRGSGTLPGDRNASYGNGAPQGGTAQGGILRLFK